MRIFHVTNGQVSVSAQRLQVLWRTNYTPKISEGCHKPPNLFEAVTITNNGLVRASLPPSRKDLNGDTKKYI